jgi:hypothetical protein
MKNLTKTFGSFFAVFSSNGADSLGGFLGVIQGLVKGITAVLIPFQIALDLIVRSINELIKVINLFPGPDLQPLKTIVTLPGDPQYKAPTAGRSFSGGSGSFSSSFDTGVPATGGGGITPNPGLAAAAASAAVTNQYFGGAINTGSSNYGGLGGAGTSGGGSTVTVNIGVVGDPEAAARTITDVMNNSYYRGTGGANAFALARA